MLDCAPLCTMFWAGTFTCIGCYCGNDKERRHFLKPPYKKVVAIPAVLLSVASEADFIQDMNRKMLSTRGGTWTSPLHQWSPPPGRNGAAPWAAGLCQTRRSLGEESLDRLLFHRPTRNQLCMSRCFWEAALLGSLLAAWSTHDPLLLSCTHLIRAVPPTLRWAERCKHGENQAICTSDVGLEVVQGSPSSCCWPWLHVHCRLSAFQAAGQICAGMQDSWCKQDSFSCKQGVRAPSRPHLQGVEEVVHISYKGIRLAAHGCCVWACFQHLKQGYVGYTTLQVINLFQTIYLFTNCSIVRRTGCCRKQRK